MYYVIFVVFRQHHKMANPSQDTFLNPANWYEIEGPSDRTLIHHTDLDRLVEVLAWPDASTQPIPHLLGHTTIRMPVFNGIHLDNFLDELRFYWVATGISRLGNHDKKLWLTMACVGDARKIVERWIKGHSFRAMLYEMIRVWSDKICNASLWGYMKEMPALPYKPDPSDITILFMDIRDMNDQITEDERLDEAALTSFLVTKINIQTLKELIRDRYGNTVLENSRHLEIALCNKAAEDLNEMRLDRWITHNW